MTWAPKSPVKGTLSMQAEAVSASSLLPLRPCATSLPSCQLASLRRNQVLGRAVGLKLWQLSATFSKQRQGLAGRLNPLTMAAAAQAQPIVTVAGLVDYYELLGIDDDAEPATIKSAYRNLAKQCHPDFLGDAGHNICVVLNEAYDVLMDPWKREQYNAQLQQALEDESDGYTGELLSKWCVGTDLGKNEDPAETRAVFVDEATCIGCKNCVWCAPATFRIEPEYGRSRVFGQWLDTEDNLKAAIDSCPVSCIHWVEKADLPALEYCIQNVVRKENVAMMMAGQGRPIEDVFNVASRFLRQREEREKKRASSRQYTAAQEAARQRAAEEIMHKQSNWFSTIGALFGMSYNTAMGNMGYGKENEDDESVGRRKRSAPVRYQEQTGGSIPPERALVPVRVYAKQPSELP